MSKIITDYINDVKEADIEARVLVLIHWVIFLMLVISGPLIWLSECH